MSTEVFNMILRDYPIEMQVSASRRALYYHISEGEALPLWIRRNMSIDNDKDEPNYRKDKDGWVVDINGEKLIRNKKTAGTPNVKKISGQDIWNGNMIRHDRNRMKKFLTDYFTPNIVRQLPPTLFVKATAYFHFEFIFYRSWDDVITANALQDIDNHAYPYIKAFMDCLVALKVITNDTAIYFRGYYPRYVHLPVGEERRLEIKVHVCDNNERIN